MTLYLWNVLITFDCVFQYPCVCACVYLLVLFSGYSVLWAAILGLSCSPVWPCCHGNRIQGRAVYVLALEPRSSAHRTLSRSVYLELRPFMQLGFEKCVRYLNYETQWYSWEIWFTFDDYTCTVQVKMLWNLSHSQMMLSWLRRSLYSGPYLETKLFQRYAV